MCSIVSISHSSGHQCCLRFVSWKGLHKQQLPDFHRLPTETCQQKTLKLLSRDHRKGKMTLTEPTKPSIKFPKRFWWAMKESPREYTQKNCSHHTISETAAQCMKKKAAQEVAHCNPPGRMTLATKF